MKKPSVAVVLHERDTLFDQGSTNAGLILRLLGERGHTVHILRGPRSFVPADIVWPHIDLTRIPAGYLALLRRYPASVNPRLIDISKRVISRQQLGPDSPYAGPVIVKTDENCGGNGDAASLRFLPRQLENIRLRLCRRLPAHWRFRWSRRWVPLDYPVFDSLRQVPPAIFANPWLVVEKFLPERDGEFYCLRSHVFLGDRSRDLLMKSRDRVIKGSRAISREETIPNADVLAWRTAHGMTFGKIDYGIHEGQTIIYDVNTTPTIRLLPGQAISPILEAMIHHLTPGLPAAAQPF